MFPIFSTASAIIICLVGLELNQEAPAAALSPFASTALLIIPLGEALILLARRRRTGFRPGLLKACMTFFSLYPVCSFGIAVFFFGWSRFPEMIGLPAGIFIDKAALLLSYLFLSNLTRRYRNRFTRAAGFQSRASGRIRLRIAMKGELTVVVPFLIFVLFSDLLHLNESVSRLVNHLPVLFWSTLFILFLALVYAMPMLVKLLWGMKPLPPDSPLRQELLRFIAHQQFKARDILVLHTGGQLVNAAIIGLTAGSRYIIFTDAMLRSLTQAELKAVMGHELGHGIQKHMAIYLIFSTAFVFGISLIDNFISPMAEIEEEFELLITLIGPAVLVYWWLVFGFLSRRFEMEADIFGARAVNDPELFINTLNKVAHIGHVEPKKGSWRHFSIARRTSLLRKYFYEAPDSVLGFWRRMKRIRWGIVLLFLLLLIPFLGDVAVDTIAGMGLLAMEDGDYQKAQAHLETAALLPGGSAHRWALFPVYLESGQLERADRLLLDLTEGMTAGSAPAGVRPYFIELGLAYLDQGSFGPCSGILDKAIHLFPNNLDLKKLDSFITLFLRGDKKPLVTWIDQWKARDGDEPADPIPVEELPAADGAER